jgi:hypothetical protein
MIFLVVVRQPLNSFANLGRVRKDVSTFCSSNLQIRVAGPPLTVATSVSEPIFTVMFSRRQIARDWCVAKSYVDKCVTQRGCPTSSLEEARQWREENTKRRAPTDQKSIALQTEEKDSPEASILIPLADARDMAWGHYDKILDLVLALPKNAAAQCNPADPQFALTVLESECTSIHCATYEVYAAWSKVGPHISTATDAE